MTLKNVSPIIMMIEAIQQDALSPLVIVHQIQQVVHAVGLCGTMEVRTLRHSCDLNT